MKITSPAPGYTGVDHYGATELKFEDGVATFDGDLPDGVRQYLVGAGYGLGSSKPTEPAAAPVPADPREVTESKVGTPLRDAAVDPDDGDFLPPTNAGEPGELGNPHGPHVVSPGIHEVSGPGPAAPEPGTAASDLSSAADLKGQALEVALTEAGLPKSGTADEKRQRLVDAGLASA